MNLRVVRKLIGISIKNELAYRINLVSMVSHLTWLAGIVIAWSLLGGFIPLPIPPGLVVPYFLLVGLFSIGRSWSLAHRVSRDINSGQIVTKLKAPLDTQLQWVLTALPVDIFYNSLLFVVAVCSLILLGIPLYNLIGAILLAAIGTATILQLVLITGIVAFWFEESWGFINATNAFISFFAGEFIPLNMLPGAIKDLANLLPMKLIGYTPAMMALGLEKFSWDLVLLGLFWFMILFSINRALWRMGMKKLTSHGI